MTTEPAEAPRLWLEDLAVGQTFESASRSLSVEAVKAFAAEFDPQPFHLDEAAAEASFFGGLAASGWHTASLTMRLLVESVPLGGGLIGAGGELTWPRPTRPGDTLRVVSVIAAIRPSASRPGRAMLTVTSTTYNQRDEPVQIMTSHMLAHRRPRPAGG